ncbi:MAG: NUDIX domain-containing protein [Lachnospiraceae bacterium]|nr:NUDIX domain-containing protein [Lachnospiraceae bacterium]
MAEYWDLYDGAGQLTGEKHLRGTAVPEGRFHKVVHIWIQNSKGELLMQKRSDIVDNCPGEWAATGGSVQAGEEPLSTAVRELSEELGLTVSAKELRYCLMVQRKDAFCYVYVLKKDVPAESLSLQKCEVAAAEWMTLEQVDRMVTERTMHRYVYRELLDAYLK